MEISQENLHVDILRVKGLIWQIFKFQLLSVDLHTHGTLHGSYVWRKLLKIPSPVIGSSTCKQKDTSGDKPPPPGYNFPR